MTEQELLQMRDLAEAGKVQFKERANDRYDIGCEMVAFSNSCGGRLIIGISDSREITHAANEFVITIPRIGNQVQSESNQVADQPKSESEQPANQVAHKIDIATPKVSNQPTRFLTKLSQVPQKVSNLT